MIIPVDIDVFITVQTFGYYFYMLSYRNSIYTSYKITWVPREFFNMVKLTHLSFNTFLYNRHDQDVLKVLLNLVNLKCYF